MQKKKVIPAILALSSLATISNVDVKAEDNVDVKTNVDTKTENTNYNKFELDWVAEFGEDGQDSFKDIIPVVDGGYVAVGEGALVPAVGMSEGDSVIIKYDEEGKVEWEKVLQGAETDIFYTVVEMADRSLIALGKSYSNDLGFANDNEEGLAIVAKFSKDGNREWIKSLNNVGEELDFKKAILSPTGNILAIGMGDNAGEYTGFISEIDGDGNLISKTYIDAGNVKALNGETIEFDSITLSNIKQNKNKEHYLIGKSNVRATGEEPMVVLKYHPNGDIYNVPLGTNTEKAEIKDLIEISDTELVIAGTLDGGATDKDGFIRKIKFNNTTKVWDMEWEKLLAGNKVDEFKSVYLSEGEELFVIGQTASTDLGVDLTDIENDIIISKYTLDGNRISLQATGNHSILEAVTYNEDEEILIAGSIYRPVLDDTGCAIGVTCTQPNAMLMKLGKFIVPEDTEKPPTDTEDKPSTDTNKPSTNTNTNTNSSTQKPQTGDNFIVYGSYILVSTAGLVRLNKKRS